MTNLSSNNEKACKSTLLSLDLFVHDEPKNVHSNIRKRR